MPPTRFTKQEAISALNKALPPSSTAIHNPGLVSEGVQLVHEFLGPGWGVDQLRFQSFTGAVAATTIATDIVPQGKYRYVFAAHGVQLASGVQKAFSLVIFDNVTTLDAVVAGMGAGGAGFAKSYPVGYVGVTVWLPRPIVVPPGCGLAHNAAAADGVMQLMLRVCSVDLDIGETPPIRF